MPLDDELTAPDTDENGQTPRRPDAIVEARPGVSRQLVYHGDPPVEFSDPDEFEPLENWWTPAARHAAAGRIKRNCGRTRTPQRTGARRRGAGRPAGRRAATRTSSSSSRGDPHLADGDPEPPGPRLPRGPSA